MRGIYKITNKTTSKVYIGESLNIIRRWAEHKGNLNENKHHSYKLQQDWNKYGQDDFTFEIVAVLDETISNFIDKYISIIFEYIYINEYNSIDEGYNVENTLLCVVNKTKAITNNIEKDYKICKIYCNMYENEELINEGGIIYINNYRFRDINNELGISNDMGKVYFKKSSFYNDAKGKILKEDDKYINEIIKNSSYSNAKFTHILYEHILEELKEIMKSSDNSTNTYEPKNKINKSKTIKNNKIKITENKVNTNDLKTINPIDLDKGFYNLNNSIKDLTSKYILKISYTDLFKLLRNEGILEYRKYNDRKYNYPTDKYRDIFIVVGLDDNKSIRLVLTKESEELIINTMNKHNVI